MLEFISKDVREYMEQNHLEFTDREKAALIYHSGLPVLEMLDRLEKLAETTEDASLREQIHKRLAYDRQDMEAFWNNAEGYVYAVENREDEREPYNCGYFASADLAYAHGMKQGCKFIIEKHFIVGFNGREAKKSKGYFNPYLFEEMDIKECITETAYDGWSEAAATYSKDGILEYFWSSEIERSDEEHISMSYDPARFENAFFPVPNPFEKGDVVRSTEHPEEHGIVATSQQEWKEFLERVESRRRKGVDFSDASITVDFLEENGHFSHSHINPAFLEKYEPQKDDADYDVLMCASGVHQGNGTLDFLFYYLKKYQEAARKK